MLANNAYDYLTNLEYAFHLIILNICLSQFTFQIVPINNNNKSDRQHIQNQINEMHINN